MNKNYYDILQINKNASPEIIEKAYKTLAKKYHPDLQPEENKLNSEQILKEINEAYEILSNPEKKAIYDQNLQEQYVSSEDYNEIYRQNKILQDEINNIQKNNINSNPNYDLNTNIDKNNLDNNFYKNNSQNNNQQEIHSNYETELLKIQKEKLKQERELQYAREKAYHDAYIQDLKNRGYKIRYKKTFKDYVRILISFVILFAILFVLWHIPFIKNFFVRLYKENEIIKALVDTILKLFNK